MRLWCYAHPGCLVKSYGCRKAAEQGQARAQDNLGDCYYYGNGIEQDYQTAVEWYRKAAEQRYARAQYDLGYCYEQGQGIEIDG